MYEPLSSAHRFWYRLFGPFIVIFLLYLGVGYYFSLATTLPQLSKYVLLLITLLFIAIIFVFVRHTGAALYKARDAKGINKLKWVLSFLLLFIFSGYGFISASMLLVEGPVIINEALRTSIDGLSSLGNAASDLLPVREYQELRGRVETESLQLSQEIKSPNSGHYCGVGPRAKEIIAAINKDLNNAVVIGNGDDRDHDCNSSQQIGGLQRRYESVIKHALDTHPLVAQYRIDQRSELQNNLSRAISKEQEQLTKVLAELSTVPHFIFNLDLYHRSVAELETAKSLYDINYKKLADIVDPEKIKLPSYLNITSTEKIASPIQVLNTIASRLDRPSTYIYIFIALAADFFASYLASVVFLVHKRAEASQELLTEATNVGGTDVTYIWVPERHLDRKAI
jgi:hypothetical protein